MKLELIRTYCRRCNKTLYTKDGKPAFCHKCNAETKHSRGSSDRKIQKEAI